MLPVLALKLTMAVSGSWCPCYSSQSHAPELGVSPREEQWQPQPALKVCITTGLSKKEIEKARKALGEKALKGITDAQRAQWATLTGRTFSFRTND